MPVSHEISWSRNYDREKQAAAADKKPLLLDFTAAPM